MFLKQKETTKYKLYELFHWCYHNVVFNGLWSHILIIGLHIDPTYSVNLTLVFELYQLNTCTYRFTKLSCLPVWEWLLPNCMVAVIVSVRQWLYLCISVVIVYLYGIGYSLFGSGYCLCKAVISVYVRQWLLSL